MDLSKKLGNNQFEKVTTDIIIQRFKNKHGDKYDYSKVEYQSMHTKVCIICPKHGEFWQTPHNHLKGQNCPLCAKEKRKTKELYNNQQKFIELSKQKFGNKFDYSKVNYENNRNKVTLICSKHGEISVIPYEHLSSQFGCKQCAVESVGKERINTYAHHFFHKANIIHSNKYNYDNSVYNGISQSIVINCPIHGDFTQIASYHLDGCGCPVCGCRLSKGENEIYEFIKSKKIEVIRNDRNIIKPLELDLYLPNSNIAIEYNGLIWHSEQYKYNPIMYHLEKTEKCNEQGIRLIHIFEDEWLEKKEIVKSRLCSILGINSTKIYARKCEIREVSPHEAMQFLINNHIQGKCKAKCYYGLYYNSELVSLMVFGKIRQQRKYYDDYDNKWELLRFCNKLNTTVVGGASKLLKHFINEVHPKSIISYADKRWSDGNLYKKLGFTHTHDSKPNYFYVIGQHRENRFNYRKNNLIKQGFDPNKTEHEIMLERNIYRIYDCGTMVFKLNL